MPLAIACPRCRKKLTVPSNLAGRRAKCPHCASPFQVPGGARPTGKSAQAVAPRPAPMSNNPFDSLDDPGGPSDVPTPRYQTRRRGSFFKKLLFVLLFFGFLGGGAYAAVRFKLVDIEPVRAKVAPVLAKVGIKWDKPEADTKPETTDKEGTKPDTSTTKPETPKAKDPPAALTDLHFVPDNSAFVLMANFETLTASKAFEKIRDEAKKVAPGLEKMIDDGLKPKAGMQFAALGRVIMAGTPEEGIFIIRPRNPLTIDELKPNKTGEYKEMKVGRFTMHEGKDDSWCLADERMVLFSDKADLLRKVLERDKEPELKPEMAAALKALNPAKALGVATLPPEAQKALAGSFPAAGKPEFEPIGKAQSLVLQADLANGLEVSVTMIFKDAAGAEAVKKLLDETVTMGKQFVEAAKKDEMVNEADAKKLEEAIGLLKIAVKEAELTVTFALPSEQTLELIDLGKKAFGKEAN